MLRTAVQCKFLLRSMLPADLMKTNWNIRASAAVMSKCKNVHLINVTAIRLRAGHLWLGQLQPHEIQHTHEK